VALGLHLSARHLKLLVLVGLLLTLGAGLLYRTGILFPADAAPGTSSQIQRSASNEPPSLAGQGPQPVEAPDQQGPPSAEPQHGGSTPSTDELLTVYFYPNDADPFKRVARQHGGRIVEELYDPHVTSTLKRVVQRVARMRRAQVAIRARADTSLRDDATREAARALAWRRAEALREAIANALKRHAPRPQVRYSLAGAGWSDTEAPDGPPNHARERRAEIRVTGADSAHVPTAKNPASRYRTP